MRYTMPSKSPAESPASPPCGTRWSSSARETAAAVTARGRIDVTSRAKICRTPLLGIAALVASCATAPPQPSPPPGAGSTAELLANAIYAKLNANQTYYFRHVDVRLENGGRP